MALGSEPVRDLAEAMKKRGVVFYTIGDCEKPQNIRQATYAGSLIGRQI